MLNGRDKGSKIRRKNVCWKCSVEDEDKKLDVGWDLLESVCSGQVLYKVLSVKWMWNVRLNKSGILGWPLNNQKKNKGEKKKKEVNYSKIYSFKSFYFNWCNVALN